MPEILTLAEFAMRARPFLALLPADERAAATRMLEPGPDFAMRLLWLLEAITLRNPHMLAELDRLFAALHAAPEGTRELWIREAHARRHKPT